MPGDLVLITGAQASGKSTVGAALAARLDRSVCIDGGPELPLLIQTLYADEPALVLRLVVLDPGPAVIADRESGRSKTGYTETITIEALVRAVREVTPRLGLWLNTGDLDVTATVDAILAGWDASLVPPLSLR